MGTRWNCNTCSRPSIDFCTDCLVTQLQSPHRHPLTHSFIGLRVSLIDSSVDPFQTSRLPSEADSDEFQDNSDNHLNDIKDEVFDKDYRFQKSEYNYLDPNFLPQ